MGLSGRKVKQRIGKDPRNLSWADDASRFGQSYLEKFGWDASKGLGASGEGRTSAVKMSQKLDMLGIGMQRHQNDPDGIAWRQNRDFENLLQRLNEGTEATGPFHEARGSSSSSIVEEEVAAEVDGSHGADEGAGTDTTKQAKKKKKQKKRKALQEEDEDEKAARDKRERKKRKKSKNDVPEDDASSLAAAAPASESTPAPTAPIAAPAPVRALPRAHRARIIAAKRMAASNSTALAEILGIPSSSTTVSPSPLTAATAATTPTPTRATSEDADPLQKLTTAAQSVGDYLRAKLGAKAGARQNSIALVQDADRDDDDDDPPRAGLGAAARLVMTGPPDGSVRAASMLAAMFARGQATAGAKEEADVAGVERADDDGGGAGDEEERRKREGRHAKEERRKRKEDRRRRKEGKMRAIAEPDAEPPNGARTGRGAVHGRSAA
ncbi:hypothetical protein EDB92DRAFT_1592067 [Lactarius akahatsu]|uniref:PinX1-related protein 1 n=1 Tax=Lactarius akahatsu TaxID=416441 RepID=A0AAD4LLN3_9AGAM|nr:hypothetical protein EDB92DRAFT_1592067 [Lactarius akahatsu]